MLLPNSIADLPWRTMRADEYRASEKAEKLIEEQEMHKFLGERIVVIKNPICQDYCIWCAKKPVDRKDKKYRRGYVCYECIMSSYPLGDSPFFCDYQLKYGMTEKEAQASDQWCKCAKKEQIYLKEHNFTGGYVCQVCTFNNMVSK